MNKSLLLLFASVFLLLGCFASVNENRYYLLDYVPTPPAERLEKGPYSYSLRIKDFEVGEAYRRNNLVYRKSPHELLFYNYELWAVKPEYLVTDMVFRHFEAADLFTNVTRTLDLVEPDFVLSGQVMALEEYDNENEWYAHIAMNMTLQNVRTREQVWSKAWDYRKKVRQLEPVFVVRELSALLEVIVEEAVASIDSTLAKSPKPALADSTPSSVTEPGHILPPPQLPVPEMLPPPDGELP